MSLVRDIEVIVQLFPSQYLKQKPQTASYLEYCWWSLSENLQK